MIVYCPSITPRLRYVCGFVSKELGIALTLTDKKEGLALSGEPTINYSDSKIEAESFWIQAHGLLTEKNIRQQEIKCFEASGQKAFFKTNGDLPFDIFAALFYLLSRYEEYLPHKKDEYGRYDYKNSLAFKEEFLDKPLINLWLKEFRSMLLLKWTGPNMRSPVFSFISTYDIDEAFSFRYKSWSRNTGAALKDMLKGNWQRVKFRNAVRSNKVSDPFDSYAWIDALYEKYHLQPRYFFLVAVQKGKYDRNTSPTVPAFQTIIQQHASKYAIGIHPSWQSGDDTALLKKEIATLSSITGKKTDLSRQHFIRFSLPQTFRQLINEGIREDHSMGYGSINGFRASVASSFYWYDLEKEEQTSLLLHPFCYMEANSFFEQRYSPQQALDEMRHYYKIVREVGGELSMIWHNTFLGTDPLFKGWRDVYEQFIDEVGGGKFIGQTEVG